MSNNNVPCYIFSVSSKGLVTELNHPMGEVLGYGPTEVVGKLRFEDLLTGGSRIFYKTHFIPILMLDGRIDEIFLSLKSRSGKELPVLLNMKLISKNGEQEIRGAGLQITKRSKFEKEIIQAKQAAEKALTENVLLNQLKSQLEESQTSLEMQVREQKRINEEQVSFNKILAHDLQEPLRKLQVFTSRLEEKGTQKIDFNPSFYLDRIYNISKYAHKLLVRLQGYHSLEVYVNDYKTAGIVTVVNMAISRLGLQTIFPDFEKVQVKEIYGDIPKLTRLFEELIHNSYQFRSPEKPLSIVISTNSVKKNYYQSLDETFRFVDFVKIRFKDNSIGFPSDACTTIFKPLQKYHDKSGTGLGLAYCKKIIELHKGKIAMKPALGGGSEFIILLPAK